MSEYSYRSLFTMRKLAALSAKENNGAVICYYCGMEFHRDYQGFSCIQVDHKIPQKSILTRKDLPETLINDIGNLVLSCGGCNSAKKERDDMFTFKDNKVIENRDVLDTFRKQRQATINVNEGYASSFYSVTDTGPGEILEANNLAENLRSLLEEDDNTVGAKYDRYNNLSFQCEDLLDVTWYFYPETFCLQVYNKKVYGKEYFEIESLGYDPVSLKKYLLFNNNPTDLLNCIKHEVAAFNKWYSSSSKDLKMDITNTK